MDLARAIALNKQLKYLLGTKFMTAVSTQQGQNQIKVIHAIPGRIRVRVPQLAYNSEYAQRLQQLALLTAGVTSVRINPSVASVVITYQADPSSNSETQSHLVNLIQTAEFKKDLPQLPTAKSEIKDLQQQLAQAKEDLTTQAKSYQSLKQQNQEQSQLIDNLKQQVASLRREAAIGERQLNKWRYRTFYSR